MDTPEGSSCVMLCVFGDHGGAHADRSVRTLWDVGFTWDRARLLLQLLTGIRACRSFKRSAALDRNLDLQHYSPHPGTGTSGQQRAPASLSRGRASWLFLARYSGVEYDVGG